MDVAQSAPQEPYYHADWELRGEHGVYDTRGYAYTSLVPDQHSLWPG